MNKKKETSTKKIEKQVDKNYVPREMIVEAELEREAEKARTRK
jgi:hypothetical protein